MGRVLGRGEGREGGTQTVGAAAKNSPELASCAGRKRRHCDFQDFVRRSLVSRSFVKMGDFVVIWAASRVDLGYFGLPWQPKVSKVHTTSARVIRRRRRIARFVLVRVSTPDYSCRGLANGVAGWCAKGPAVSPAPRMKPRDETARPLSALVAVSPRCPRACRSGQCRCAAIAPGVGQILGHAHDKPSRGCYASIDRLDITGPDVLPRRRWGEWHARPGPRPTQPGRHPGHGVWRWPDTVEDGVKSFDA